MEKTESLSVSVDFLLSLNDDELKKSFLGSRLSPESLREKLLKRREEESDYMFKIYDPIRQSIVKDIIESRKVKQPIGLLTKTEHDTNRLVDIMEYCIRYLHEGKQIKREWLGELNNLLHAGKFLEDGK